MECTFHNAKFLLKLFDNLKELNPILNIECSPDGWKCNALNNDKTCLTVFKLSTSFFLYYKCDRQLNIVLQTEKALKQLKTWFVSHNTKNTKLHVLVKPNSTRVHMRMDFFDTSQRASEFELPQSEDVPQAPMMPEVGDIERIQFPTATLKKIVGDMAANNFDDTMTVKMQGEELTMIFEKNKAKAMVKQSHDESSSKLHENILTNHIETTQELLMSLNLVQHIAKNGNMGPYWELLFKHGR